MIDEAETRRGVPSVNARWSNIVAILAGDYLLARASELAASLGAPRRRAARDDDRRAVPRSGARAAAPLRRRPQRGDLLLRDRRQDRGAVRDRVSHRRDGLRGRRPDARRAHRVRPPPRRVLPDRRRRARRHRLRRVARQARRQRPDGGRVHAPRDPRPRPDRPSCASCSAASSTTTRSRRRAGSPTSDGAVDAALDAARDQAARADKVLAATEGLDPDVTGGMRRLVDDLVARDS